ncbi:MAG: cytochrome b N-terminal domain-containing protein [Kofleriaceae bacterium]
MTMRLTEWVTERVRALSDQTRLGIPGGPSLAYVAGWVIVMLLGVEAITGAALSAFYAPSTASAWASVAYIKDQVPLGWFVRGLHFHATSALVIVTGAHLVQTAIYGAYKKPRELVWWLGLVLMVLVLGFAISGYVLRWDQAGYWSNHVEIGITASAPLAGPTLKGLALGGNDYGNLTLTRFYALHIVALPGIVLLVVGGHLWTSRLHGSTPRWGHDGLAATRRWPRQTLRDVVAMAIVFAILIGYVISQHGADLAAPADPGAAYDARPLWYFRWLFELRHLAGSMERAAALLAPVIVGGFLVGLPLIDRSPDRSPRKRLPYIGAVVGLFVLITVLTLKSFATDAGDEALAKRQAASEMLASRARALAVANGVPITGAQDVFKTVPMYTARSIFEHKCKGCHDAHSKDRKGPIIGAGHGNRAWFEAFLRAPSGDAFWGRTKLAATEDAMKAVELTPAELGDLTELLYAQSGASDADATKRARGQAIFDKACTDCHSTDEGVAGASGPGLGDLGSRDWYTSFISNPKKAVHMGTLGEMPRFDGDLTIIERDAVAGYLTWLRTASQADLDKLGPL